MPGLLVEAEDTVASEIEANPEFEIELEQWEISTNDRYIIENGTQQQIIQLFEQSGMDAMSTDEFGQTALMISIMNPDIRVMQYMLSLQPDTSAIDNNGRTAIHLTIDARKIRHFSVLASDPSVDLMIVDSYHMTPLAHAITRQFLPAVRMLIKYDNLVNEVLVHTNFSLLDLAVEQHRFAMPSATSRCIIAELLRVGCDSTRITAFDGRSPFHRALSLDNMYIVKLMLEHGANITHYDNRGLAPIHIVVHTEYIHGLRFLLLHGADVDAMTKNVEQTAFHMAARLGQVRLCRILYEEGASLMCKDYAQKTVKDYLDMHSIYEEVVNTC